MDKQQIDTAIVGGGLAGCSAAITLAARGLSVAVFEASHYPHHKVCGEFLSPECHHLLAELGLADAIAATHPAALNVVQITAPNGSSWQTDLPGTGIGLRRYTLDALMAQQARARGAMVCEGTTVSAVSGNLIDGFVLEIRSTDQSGTAAASTIHARTVIGAQGKRSLFDRALKRSFLSRPQPFIGLKAHYRGPSLSNRIELHTFPGGYCGISEVEDGSANVCLLVRDSTFRFAANGAGIDAFIDWMQAQNPHLGKWLQQATRVSERWISISQVPFSDKSAIVNDVLMAGDSAGLIAPLAGDGMGMALHAGRMAASYVGDFLDGHMSTDRLRREYPQHWKREFTTRLYLGRFLQAFMLRPRLLTPGLKIVKAFPALGTFFVNHTRDTDVMKSPAR